MIIQAKTISPVTSASPAEAVRGELMNSLARGIDTATLDFSEWLEMYSEWKKMDEVKAYLKKLYTNPPGNLCATGEAVQ